jgi:hypothetical protein
MEAVPRIVGGPAATAGHGRCRGLLHARRTTPQALCDAVSLARRGRPRCLRHGASTRSADGPSRPGDGPDEVHPVDDRWLRWRADVGRRAHAPAVAVRAPTAPSEPRWTTPLSAPPPDRPRDNRLSAPRVARHMITVTYEDRRVATGVPVCRRPEQGRVTELGAGLASGLNTRRSGRSPLSVGLRRRARRSKPRPTARRCQCRCPLRGVHGAFAGGGGALSKVAWIRREPAIQDATQRVIRRSSRSCVQPGAHVECGTSSSSALDERTTSVRPWRDAWGHEGGTSAWSVSC